MGIVVAAGGCGAREDGTAVRGGEPAVLARLLGVSHALVDAYAAVAAALGGSSRGRSASRGRPARELPAAEPAARDVLAAERSSAARLEAALRAAGRATVPSPAGALAEAAGRAVRAAGSGDGRGALRALVEAERAAGAARIAALPLLGTPAHRVLAARVIAAGAQHQSALLAALGRDPVPDAFAGLTPS